QGPQPLTLGRARGLVRWHRVNMEPAVPERRHEVRAERRGVPGHEGLRLPLAGDAVDQRRNGAQGRRAVEDTGHALELATELLQRLGPALGELSTTRLRFGRRVVG